MTLPLDITTLGIVGCGAMGRGIVQIAALAGLQVRLFDAAPDAAEAARNTLADTLKRLQGKGKLQDSAVTDAMARMHVARSLDDFVDCDVVVEAIVEDLAIKQTVFRHLEAVVRSDAILASNTSSLSITAIAAGCSRPERVVGFHFFNPVPVMRLVEVIEGVRTAPSVSAAMIALAKCMGHTPVRAKDTPGFIVNHAGRAFGTEALRVVGEGVTDFVTVDRILRDAAGFKLGPFELMDLTGLDVSHPVMESIYHQYYEEPRYRPSVITAQRFSAGLLGRKTGQGFYVYADGKQQAAAETPPPAARPVTVWISPAWQWAHDQLRELVVGLGGTLDQGRLPSPDSLIVVTPLGDDASFLAARDGKARAHRIVQQPARGPAELAVQ